MAEAQYETHAAGVAPGDTQQLSYRWDQDITLKALVLDRGLQLVRVIAGKTRIEADAEGKATWGQSVKAKAYVIAIVKNVSTDPIIGKGTWFVEGSGLTPQAQTAQVLSGVIPPRAVPVLRTDDRKSGMTRPRTGGQSISSYPVGKNELAVAMTFGECRRLLDCINGATPIQAFERPQFLRRFNHALAIFQGQEVPTEAPGEVNGQPSEKDDEISALRMRIAELTEEKVKLKTELDSSNSAFTSVMQEREGTSAFELGYKNAVDDLLEFVNERQEGLSRKAEVIRLAEDIKKNGFNVTPPPVGGQG